MIELPTLYGRARNGDVMQWRAYSQGDLCCFEHGKLGGKQTVHKDRAKVTNEGRANQRTPQQQADFEAKAAWEKKLKEGYFESMDDAKNAFVFLPMLAHPLMKSVTRKGVKSKIQRELTFPLDVQFKYNGLRATSAFVATTGVTSTLGPPHEIAMRSRQGEEWTILSHITGALKALMREGEVVDGEAYTHGVPLQTLNSYVKVSQPGTQLLTYMLYDMPIVDGNAALPWEERREHLRARWLDYARNRCVSWGVQVSETALQDHLRGVIPNVFLTGLPLQVAPTWRVNGMDEVSVLNKMALEGGYEGLILRQLDRPYEFNSRTESLLKFKTFTDAEFVVVDIPSREYFPPDGSPSYLIADKFMLRNDRSDATFEAVPKGTMAMRRDYFVGREGYIGQLCTVRFLERSVSGIPQGNPVALGFRLAEDRGREEDKIWDGG